MSIFSDTLKFSKDIATNVGNYFSNRRIPTASSPKDEASKAIENAPIMIEHLQIINALPPIYDNIVDPPVETSSDDYQYNLTTLFNKNSYTKASVGRAYIRNVLASGNYITLVPLEFDFSSFDAVKNISDGALANTVQSSVTTFINQVKGSRANPASLWKTFNEAIDIGSFGYVTKIAGKRYWRHVAANMKAVIYAMGIEYVASAGGNGELTYPKIMKDAIPSWIVDNLLENKFYDRWNMEVNNRGISGEVDISNFSNEDKNKWESLQTELTNSKNIEQQLAYNYNNKSYRSSKEIQADIDKLINKNNSNKTTQEETKNLSEASFYGQESIKKLQSWVMAASGSNMIQDNLPFVTFYVNGIIEKNMGASQNVGESELGAILSGNFTMDMLKKLGSGDKSNKATATSVIANTAQAAESVVRELSYVGNEATAGYFASGYVPRVNKGVDGDISYSINLRALADGSDPISIAAHCMYTLALITPFYVEPTHKAYKYSFVPKAPLICSAFCKGVFNVPKGCISNIDIKTDPVFQTTESISTDIEISITLVPFINKGFSPDFGNVFNATSDEHHIITAFFNPFSSLNVLITLCGMNTTMTKMNEGLFQYFFWKKPTSIVNIAFESWEGFKSSFVDFSSTTIRNLGLARNIKAQ